MSVVTGQAITRVFTTRNISGGSVAADSLPTSKLYVAGVFNAATVTVANITGNVYSAALTLPTLTVGSTVDLSVTATVQSVADTDVIWTDICDLNINSSGNVGADIQTIKTQAVTAAAGVTFPGSVGTSTYSGGLADTNAAAILTNAQAANAGTGTISAYLTTNLGLLGANATALAQSSIWTGTIANRIDANVSSRMATFTLPTGFTTTTFASTVGTSTFPAGGNVGTATSVTGSVGSVTGAVGSVTGLNASLLDVAVSTRSAPATAQTITPADTTAAQMAQSNIVSIGNMIASLPSASTIATAVWAATTRTLSAISDSSGITTLLSRISSALTISGGKVAATIASGDGVDDASNKTALAGISNGSIGVNATQFGGHNVVLDANNYPSVNVVDVNGHQVVSTAGKLWVLDDNGNSITGGMSVAAAESSLATAIGGISGGGGGLSGPSQLTIHYQDSTGTLVPSVELTISGSAYRANTSGGVATGITDGSYTIVSGMTNQILFPVTPVTVSGNTSVLITGAAAQIPFTPAPGSVVGSMIATDGSGNAQEGVVFDFTLLADPNGDLISGSTTTFSATTGSGGTAYAEFVPGWKYSGQRGNGIKAKTAGITFVAPNSNWQLPTMLGQ